MSHSSVRLFDPDSPSVRVRRELVLHKTPDDAGEEDAEDSDNEGSDTDLEVGYGGESETDSLGCLIVTNDIETGNDDIMDREPRPKVEKDAVKTDKSVTKLQSKNTKTLPLPICNNRHQC